MKMGRLHMAEHIDRIMGIIEENPNGLSCREIHDIMIERYLLRKKDDINFISVIGVILGKLVRNRKIKCSIEKSDTGKIIYQRKE